MEDIRQGSRDIDNATPTREEVRALAAHGSWRRIPIRRELYADSFTTIEVLRALREQSNHVFLLESAEADRSWGRWSFIGFEPSMEITCLDGNLRVRRGVGTGASVVEEQQVEHPGPFLRRVLAENRAPKLDGFPPLVGGLVGYFAYDYLKYAEPCLRPQSAASRREREDFLDVDLMLFDQLVAFDSYRQKVQLIANVAVDVGPDGYSGQDALDSAYTHAVSQLDRMEYLLREGPRHRFEPLHLHSPLAPQRSENEFARMIAEAKHHIHDGDIFQVVLSNPISAQATGSLFDTYRVLRTTNPSPYLFYFTSDDVEITGASPETLVRLTDGRLVTYPLAGTRPRGATPDEDVALESELLADEKELAEHNMLVDLGRNDLGRVAAVGSVKVENYLRVLRFSHVMHLGSTVSAQLAHNCDGVDVVDAILPAGTLSGAPKLRACQIIAELEGAKRGIYGGAVGYLSLTGDLDTCIGIRLAWRKGDEVCVQSGAGIVADSVASREWHECLNKAGAVIEALHEAQGGLKNL